MYASTQKRNRVAQLCKTDIAQARALAESIEDEWFRIQAYASLAEVAPDSELNTYIGRAEKAAKSATDAFKVGALAWLIAVCIQRHRLLDAQRLVGIAVDRAIEIQPPSSRAEALFFVWQAIFPAGVEPSPRLLDELVGACLESSHWRGERTLRDVVLMLAGENPGKAKEIVEAMPPGNYRHQAEKGIESGLHRKPISFR